MAYKVIILYLLHTLSYFWGNLLNIPSIKGAETLLYPVNNMRSIRILLAFAPNSIDFVSLFFIMGRT